MKGRTTVVVAALVWAAATLAFVALAVVLDAAELPPFATSSRWAPAMGAVVAMLPAWYVFRALRRRAGRARSDDVELGARRSA